MTQELLGDYAGASRLTGAAALVGSLAVTVVLQRLQTALVSAESSRWWASNGRDLINAVSLAALGGALWYLGFSGPTALVLGTTLLLVLNLFESVLFGRLKPLSNGVLSWLSAIALVAPLLLAPERVNDWLNALAAQLFS